MREFTLLQDDEACESEDEFTEVEEIDEDKDGSNLTESGTVSD